MEKRVIYALLGALLIFFIATILSPRFFDKELEPKLIKEKVQTFGFWAPLVIIALIVVVCMFSIVPMSPFIIAAGYLFGIFYGALYSMIALILGMSIVFFLAKKLGRPFVEKISDKKKIRKFDIFFKKWGIWALVIQRLIPFYPLNIMGFSLGLTKMRYRTFIGTYLLMTFPGLILQGYIGHLTGLIEQISLRTVVIASAAIIMSFLIAGLFLRNRIRGWILKEIEMLEKDLKGIKKRDKIF